MRVILEIDDQHLPAVPDNSEASISAANLLGTKFINVKKGNSPTPIHAGSELKSLDVSDFEDVVQQGYSTLASLQGIFKKLDGIIEQIEVGKGTIGKLLVDETLYKKVLTIADDGKKAVDLVNTALASDKGTLGKLLYQDDLYKDVRGTVARIDTLIDGLNKGEGSAGKLLKDTAVYDETRNAIADLRKLMAGLERGEGSAGKLLKSTELHDQIKTSLARVDSMLEKINNGQGTLGQLAVNPALYESLDGTTREVQGLLKDFRANPKKFLTIQLKLF